MDAPKFDKSRLPSRHVTEGPERAPHRSYYYAMGLGEAEIHQPLRRRRHLLERGRALQHRAEPPGAGGEARGEAGAGTPREFTTITVTDGIAMGHEGMQSSLASREVIADTVELTMRGHCYDALVGLAGCDKSLPGMMMAMVRLNVPVGLHLRRLDPAGPLRRPRRDGGGRVRGGRPRAGGHPARGRARHPGAGRLPAPAPAAASSPPTPWPASARRSGWRCSTPPARRRPTRAATSMRSPAASR